MSGLELHTAHQTLQRLFRVLVFDWDGTAVENRQADASELTRLIERLLQLGVWVVVVTGTKFEHVDRQLCQHLAPRSRSRLMVCTNRGSEVFRFARGGPAKRVWARLATAGEEQQLTLTAEATRDEIIRRTGLPCAIVYDRLNRRKIDLIPDPRWVDPPKSEIDLLLVEVQRRLRGAGLSGDIADVVAIAQRGATAHGLQEPRITSDVKHVEIGLTDKADSMARIRRDLLEVEGIPWTDVLIGGDEFGPVAGFPGSDDLLRHDADGATVVSVGREPNGVPLGVIHLGGGPRRFRELLADQVGRWETAHAVQRRSGPLAVFAPPADGEPANPQGWWMRHQGFLPEIEHEFESRFALSNGYLGMRGSLPEPSPGSRPRQFVSGLYGMSMTEPRVPSLVAAPNWHTQSILLDTAVMRLDRSAELRLQRWLDLRRGVLWVIWRREDDQHQLEGRHALFLSLDQRQLGVQVVELSSPSGARLVLRPRLVSADPRLLPFRQARRVGEAEVASWRVAGAHQFVAMALVDKLRSSGEQASDLTHDAAERMWILELRPGSSALFERVVSFQVGDRDAAPSLARSLAAHASRTGAVRLLQAHAQSWRRRWEAGDVIVHGDDDAQRALRFAIYHLVGAANPEDERVSIGARGLTGDAYMGHVFWDTETFMLPFYICTWPEAARALLMYRFHTLAAARAKAKAYGLRGAFYAWESAETGEEVCPTSVRAPNGDIVPIVNGEQEVHVSADVAYAVWQYWDITGDHGFLRQAGAEIILETARFWASRAEMDSEGRYHLRGVVGPDEYHDTIDNNAYTNAMARWNVECALDVANQLRRRWPVDWSRIREALSISEEELVEWAKVASGLGVSYDPPGEVIEQFDGFFRLRPVMVADYSPRTEAMDVLLGAAETRRSQVHKQADAVMLVALLWDRFPARVREATFDYYEPRCGHGSSLSPSIHALVAARLGKIELAQRYFDEAAAIDLEDAMGNAALGVHMAAQGGLWQAAVFGFAGLSFMPDGLHFMPHLPESWRRLAFRIMWRGRRVRIEMDGRHRTITVELERGKPLTVRVADQVERVLRTRPARARW